MYEISSCRRTWSMRLNVEKCKVIHFGKSNSRSVYCMTNDSGNKRKIEKTNLEKDLGVIVYNDLMWSEHVDRMVEKANRLLCMPKRTFESRDPKLLKELYVSLVRPHLEYAIKAWNPHLQGEIDKIERVQRRATRISFGFEKLVYEERLNLIYQYLS